MKLTFSLTGTRPLLANNGRLANPMDPYARKLAELVHKRTKTDEDRIAVMQVEARGGCYETAEGMLAWPNENVWRALYDGATHFKRGKDLQRGLRIELDVVPLLVGGNEISCDSFLTDPANIDYRSAKPQRNRVMRARPIIRDWSATFEMELDETVIDARDLLPILERAGAYVGMGNWRPTFGTFNGSLS